MFNFTEVYISSKGNTLLFILGTENCILLRHNKRNLVTSNRSVTVHLVFGYIHFINSEGYLGILKQDIGKTLIRIAFCELSYVDQD